MSLNRHVLRSLLAFTLLPLGLAAHAQSADSKSTDCSQLPTREQRDDCAALRAQTKTIFLTNVGSQNEANEILVAIRNVSTPSLKMYLAASQDAIVVSTYPEEMARIESLIHSLDRPHKTYRLTYTLTELDAGKTISTQHYSMLLGDGQHTSLKEGNKVPIATGSYSDGDLKANGIQTQFTYLDVGMNFDATISVSGTSVQLKSKVEESSLDQPVTISGVTEPVIRQSVLDGTSVLTLDKPAMLGTIDVPSSTHHIDIAAVVEQVK